jgi:hypothetical protein
MGGGRLNLGLPTEGPSDLLTEGFDTSIKASLKKKKDLLILPVHTRRNSMYIFKINRWLKPWWSEGGKGTGTRREIKLFMLCNCYYYQRCFILNSLSSDRTPPKTCEGSLQLQNMHYREVSRVSVVVVCLTRQVHADYKGFFDFLIISDWTKVGRF